VTRFLGLLGGLGHFFSISSKIHGFWFFRDIWLGDNDSRGGLYTQPCQFTAHHSSLKILWRRSARLLGLNFLRLLFLGSLSQATLHPLPLLLFLLLPSSVIPLHELSEVVGIEIVGERIDTFVCPHCFLWNWLLI
jgi:hypothetical protein